MAAETLYVIPNAHLDPVWLWRWRDGYSEALTTLRSAVERLRENPDMTFSQSSAAIFAWVEESDPRLFAEIRDLVSDGRFEIVGGWVVESDTIQASGESLIRQAELGKAYIQDRFKKDVTVGFSADAFGQNAGLPQILTKSGFTYYVFHRPGVTEKEMPNLWS